MNKTQIICLAVATVIALGFLIRGGVELYKENKEAISMQQFDETTGSVTYDTTEQTEDQCEEAVTTENICEHKYQVLDVSECTVTYCCSKCGAVTLKKNECEHHWVQVKDETEKTEVYSCHAGDCDFELAWVFCHTHPEAFEWVKAYGDGDEMTKQRIIEAHQKGYDRYPDDEEARQEWLNTPEGKMCNEDWKHQEISRLYYECDKCHVAAE